MATRLRFAGNLETIASQLTLITRTFGFGYFALGRFSHNLSHPPSLHASLPESCPALRSTDSAANPLLAACRGRLVPFQWAEADELRIYENFAQGWIVPFHIPDDSHGFCSFIPHAQTAPQWEKLPLLQILAQHAYDATGRILARPRTHRPPRLTPRQLQCVTLAARGKSDWVAGKLLGLAPATVHKYLEQAKARYDVSSRTELVVRALHDGHIHFQDLID